MELYLKNYKWSTPLKCFRSYFGYVHPIPEIHRDWYNMPVSAVVERLNRECSYICEPFDSACRVLCGLAIHKLLLSGIDECIDYGTIYTFRMINEYYPDHIPNYDKKFRLIEDISAIADILEKYQDQIDNELVF